jgi:endonuclease I
MRTVVALFLSVVVLADAAAPPGYYDPAAGQSGPALRQALHSIIRQHQVVPYSSSSQTDAADALKVLDQDPANPNNVLLIYATDSVSAALFGLTTGWNREHLWPNSYGLDGVHPAYSDLHNLRPCDANVNSARGNKYYDVSDPNHPNYKFPAHVEAPLCSTDGDSWEPPDFHKGDVARALFYMAVRYTGDVPNEPALKLTDRAGLITSTNDYMGRLSTLLQWNIADPVDPAERLRNDLVYSLYQGNRNPFVDHPEWVCRAFAPTLTITLDAPSAAIQLTWPSDCASAVLESTFTQPPTWTTVTNAPVLSDATWQVTLPLSTAPTLYRLRLD